MPQIPCSRSSSQHPARRLRRAPSLVVCALFALSVFDGFAGGCARRERDDRPNIVIIITDDHRADALGVAGNPRLQTPALDRLAEEGVRFTNAFVTTSLCSPSRASLMTGCYAHTHGVLTNEVREPDPALPYFSELLQKAGYETAFIGKWHMLKRATPRRGFDHWISFTGQGGYLRNTINVDGAWMLSEEYVTDALTERALRFIAKEREGPFLLVLSHKAAHAPFVPAPRHRDRYRDVSFASHDDPRDVLESKPDWGGRSQRGRLVEQIRDYQRCLLAVDESVDRIVGELRERGLLDRTAIIYTSDNGYLQGEHGGLWDKRAAYEPAIRVPLLIRYPTLVRPGELIDALALNIDLAPTVLQIAGVPVPGTMHGRSWLGSLNGEPGREDFLYEYFHADGPVPTILAIRTQEWKYVTYPDDPQLPAELYDLKYDPQELRNRAGEASYAGIVDSLGQRLDELVRETGFDAMNAKQRSTR